MRQKELAQALNEVAEELKQQRQENTRLQTVLSSHKSLPKGEESLPAQPQRKSHHQQSL